MSWWRSPFHPLLLLESPCLAVASATASWSTYRLAEHSKLLLDFEKRLPADFNTSNTLCICRGKRGTVKGEQCTCLEALCSYEYTVWDVWWLRSILAAPRFGFVHHKVSNLNRSVSEEDRFACSVSFICSDFVEVAVLSSIFVLQPWVSKLRIEIMSFLSVLVWYTIRSLWMLFYFEK